MCGGAVTKSGAHAVRDVSLARVGSVTGPAGGVAADRWRIGMLVALLLTQAVIVWEQCPVPFREISAWLADPEQRAITEPFWLHLNAVAVTLSNLALLVGAIGALVARTAVVSRRWTLAGFALHLTLQIVPRLPPLAWSYRFPADQQEAGAKVLAAAAPLEAVAAVIDLLPLLLAVTIGLLRAGARQAWRHPQASAGGALLFAATLQLALLFAIALSFCSPLVPRGWFTTGLLVLTVHYALASAVRGIQLSPRRRHVAWRVLLAISGLCLLLPGWAVELVGLQEIELYGKHLLAIGGREGFVGADQLAEHGLLFVARSVATALAANDLIERALGDPSESKDDFKS